MREARKRCELAGACALGRAGINWPRGHPPRWAQPDVGQDDAEPEQDEEQQLIVDEVWDHGMAP